jgi:hypothetical protein
LRKEIMCLSSNMMKKSPFVNYSRKMSFLIRLTQKNVITLSTDI